MKRILLLTAALLAFGSCASEAATYWLRPNGANGRTPTLDGSDSTATHALSLQWANDSLTAGDTARLSWGNYNTTGIRPKHTGNPSAGEWLRFLGDTLSPSKVVVYDVLVDSSAGAKRCVVVGGVTANSAEFRTAYCSYAGYDTLYKSVVLNTFTISGRSNVTVRNNTIGDGGQDDKVGISNNLPTNPAYSYVDNLDGTCTCTITTNNGSLRSHVVDSLYFGYNTLNLATASGSNANNLAQVGSSVFEHNRYFLAAVEKQDTHLNTMYGCKNNTIADNYYEGTVVNPVSIHYLLNLRDNATFNTFVRDTFVQSEASQGKIKIAFSTAGNDWDDGSLPDRSAPVTKPYNTDPTGNPCSPAITAAVLGSKTYDYGDSNNTFSHCVIRVGDVVEVQSRADNNLYEFNQIIGRTMLLGNQQFTARDSAAQDSVVWRHNTLVGTDKRVISTDSKINHGVFASNIILSLSPMNGGCSYGVDGHYGFGSASSFVSCDSNLVWCTAPEDSARAMDTGRQFGGCTSCPIGSYNGNPAGSWGSMFGYDLVSHWGDPVFADTSSVIDFDFTPAPTGLAYSIDLWADGYVGAVAASADATPPTVAISEPSGSRIWTTGDQMSIQWTASDNVSVASITLQWSNGYNSTNWHDIYGGVGLAGSTTQFLWTLPAFTSRWAYVRVTAYDAAGNSTSAVAPFTANASESIKDTLLDMP